MPAPELREALREADRCLHELPPEVERRLAERLARRVAPRAPWPRLALAAAVLAGAFLILRPGEERALDGFTVERGSVGQADGALTLGPGPAELHDAPRAARIHAAGPARLQRTPGGLRLLMGRLAIERPELVDVPPYEVELRDHRLALLAGRVEVAVSSDGVELQLLAGRAALDGGELVAPATRRWPAHPPASEARPSAPPPQPAPAASSSVARRPGKDRRPLPAPEPAPSVEEVLEQVAALLSRRRPAEAIAHLEQALAAGASRPTRERLSFERAAILDDQLADDARACAAWRQLAAEFPEGRYAREVAARTRAACPAP